jgi:hypothetical protein
LETLRRGRIGTKDVELRQVCPIRGSAQEKKTAKARKFDENCPLVASAPARQKESFVIRNVSKYAACKLDFLKWEL